MVKISSWGRLSADEHKVVPLRNPAALPAQLQQSAPGIAYGMGRSYGDVCLNPQGTLFSTRGLDHLISFDASTGILVCEAGTLLRDIQRLMVPRDMLQATA